MISRDTVANVTSASGDSQRATPRSFANARGFTLLCTSAYVALSGVLLAVGGRTGLSLAHLVLLCALVWATASQQKFARVVGDVAPLLLMPLLYGELPQLIAIAGSSYHDAMIQQLELRVFGEQPSHVLAAHAPVVALSELLHSAYLAYYPTIFIPAAILYATGERRGFAQLVLGITATYAMCWTIFILFPVEGPRYEWAAPLDVPNGFVRRIALAILARGSSRGAAFPSSHVAVSVVQAVVMMRWSRSAAMLLAVVALLVGIGAVYGGFHYGLDVVAGGLLGVLIGFVVLTFTRRTIVTHA